MTRIPKTWAQVKAHPAVEEVSVEPNEENVYWIYLKPGWSAASDPGLVHLGNGPTVAEAIRDTFPVSKCDCDACKH